MCFSIAFSALCCAGSMICNACCSCCKSCCKTGLQQQVRLSYVILTLSFVGLSILALYGIKDFMGWFSKYIHCPSASGGGLNCLGVSAVYRLSFSLMCFFLFIGLCCFFRNAFSKAINEGFWTLKIFCLLALFIGLFFADNSFLNGYLEFAKIFGAIYLVIQSVIFIDIFYMWAESWAKRYDQGENYCAYVCYITAILLYSGTIVQQVFNFIWFSGCGLNLFVNILNCFLVVAMTVIQVLNFNPHGSLITTGSQSIYITFLTFSAQLSGSECNQLLSNNNSLVFEMSVGVFFIFVVLFYLTFGSKKSTSGRIKTNENGDLNQLALIDEEDKELEKEDDYEVLEENEKKEGEQSKEEKEKLIQKQAIANQGEQQKQIEDILTPYKKNTYIIFHFIMFVLSIYGVMLLTNWSTPNFNDPIKWNMYQNNEASFWIKIVVSWSSSLLYTWTLIAPAIFPDRDFSNNQ